MKLLKDILYRAGIAEVSGSTNIAIENISFDSRLVGKMNLFVATRGTKVDGHQFIHQAIENGAVAVICEEFPDSMKLEVTYVKVLNSNLALGHIASNFYDHPSSRLRLIGVTGTNGKTTVSTTLYDLFTRLGYSCGLISTVRNRINQDELKATHTTPDAVAINRLLAQMVEKKCNYCFMEVSSHAIDQGRTSGLDFRGVIFTNLTHDHLDYHQTFDHYLKTKKKLFDGLKEHAFALTNTDDKHGLVMVQNSRAKKFTYSLRSQSDFRARIMESHIHGLLLKIDSTELWTRFAGEFNAYNMLAVYAAAVTLGQDKMNVLTTMSTLEPVEGRFQVIRSQHGPSAIVDYAHTPDALENVLKAIRGIVKNQKKIITVIGCGGDRDKSKRPVMGTISVSYSDRCIFTSDNPRSESPVQIIAEMKSKLSARDLAKVLSITDRREAIRTAAQMAQNEDVILIAGKGHEKYQETAGVKTYFDDSEVIQQEFDQMKNKPR